MDDCLFCKIIAGDIPSKKVYEDDLFYAFDDIEPETPIHTLVIPKQHYENLQDNVPEELLGKLMRVIARSSTPAPTRQQRSATCTCTSLVAPRWAASHSKARSASAIKNETS